MGILKGQVKAQNVSPRKKVEMKLETLILKPKEEG